MTPLFRSDGSVAICRGCRRVREGTAAFAIEHAAKCQHQRLYNALYRLEAACARKSDAYYNLDLDKTAAEARAEVVFAILGEP